VAGLLRFLQIERKYTYSYAGAAYASLSKEGYGELEFKPGHKGAGILSYHEPNLKVSFLHS